MRDDTTRKSAPAGSTPPTVAGPVPSAAPGSWVRLSRGKAILLGIAIHAASVGLACFIVPLAMGSNIWPIAGVAWSVMTVPVAAGTGALGGLLVGRARPRVAIAVLIATGVLASIATGIVIVNNR
jgi:peptidoglycan/LPS O-acetylase OafA/YrhL